MVKLTAGKATAPRTGAGNTDGEHNPAGINRGSESKWKTKSEWQATEQLELKGTKLDSEAMISHMVNVAHGCGWN